MELYHKSYSLKMLSNLNVKPYIHMPGRIDDTRSTNWIIKYNFSTRKLLLYAYPLLIYA